MKRKPTKQPKKKKVRDLKPKGSVRGGGKEELYYTITLKNATNAALTNASLRSR